jgi:ABC-type transport system involved in multi-copper enzyme maturation permease subunit
MLARIGAVAFNAYREAVRARVLYGLLGVALATTAYSLVVGTLSLHQETRVVADLGAASISLYAVAVAVVLGATSLHRELELKTLFPILTRRLRRHEYLVGKYLGAVATLGVFVAIDAAAVLAILAGEGGASLPVLGGAVAGLLAVLGLALWRAGRARVYVLMPWSIVALVTTALIAAPVPNERRMVLASAALTLCEVGIVSAIATLFSSFSSPFLTALFTLGVFALGRSADGLAHIPPRSFGETVHSVCAGIAHVVPNLHVYVPARSLLLGEVPEAPVWPFVLSAAEQALFYSALLLTVSALVFRKRDFQ